MYKTIALELIQEQPELYEQLRSSKRLLPAMDAYAIELKASHEAWKDRLSQARPGSDPSQIASEALELAIEELRDRLPSASPSGRSGAAVARRGDELHPHGIRRPRKARTRPVRSCPSSARHASPQPRRRPCRIPPAIPFHLRLRPRRGLSPATLQPEPPAATGQTAFTNDVFPKGEPSVSPVAAGTGRHDAAGGQEPGSRLSARSERPRLAGPSNAEGDRIMEGTDTTTAPPVIASGEKAKARDILAAIRTLQADRAGAAAGHRPDERQTLARFGGFGAVALSLFPDPVTGRYKDAGWQALGEELEVAARRPRNTTSAKRTTFNAFYTSPIVIAAMHEALAPPRRARRRHRARARLRHGQFPEPCPARACGSSASSWTRISGRIARALHPGARHPHRELPRHEAARGRVDAVIGNLPFADVDSSTTAARSCRCTISSSPKSLDALKPGGVLALVTSHFTLDKQNAAVREYLAERADFLGAIRLPSDAFKREGTAVVTDIVFLRKRAPGEPAEPRRPGLAGRPRRSAIEGADVPINRYFLNHPEMVLGTWSRKDRLYGGEAATASSATATWPTQLDAAIGRLPEVAHRVAVRRRRPSPHPPSSRRRPSGTSPRAASSSATTGPSARSKAGRRVPVTYGGTLLKADGTMTGKRLAALIGLRDHARRVLQSQNEGWPEAQPRRRPPRPEPGLRPLRRRLRPDQQDDLQRDRRRHASSAACPTSSNSAKTRTPCWSWRSRNTTR